MAILDRNFSNLTFPLLPGFPSLKTVLNSILFP